MNRRRKRSDTKPGAPLWMVTFSDMMTLILVFFILLFSISIIDATKFRAIADSFQDLNQFEFYPSIIPFDNPAQDSDVNKDPFDKDENPFENYLNIKEEDTDEQLDHLLSEVEEFLEENDLIDMITASRDDRGVVLVLQEQVLFDTARADIKSEAEPFLNMVGTLLKNIPNIVRVEGHTDSRPINTIRYPSNWELSGARASSVIRYLIENHDLNPERFIALGYGDTRPIAPNTTEENMQQNRRVVIVISDPSYDGEPY